MTSPDINNTQKALAASQRLLDHIVGKNPDGGQMSAPASSDAPAETTVNAPENQRATDTAAPAERPQKPASKARLASASAVAGRLHFKRHNRRSIGLVTDENGVYFALVTQVGGARTSLAKFEYYEFPAGGFQNLQEQALFIAKALKQFDPAYQTADIWTNPRETEVCVLALPPVKKEELDAVAMLHAAKQINTDLSDKVFDYRVQGTDMRQGAQVVRALGLAAPKSDVNEMVEAYKTAGIRIKGLTSRKFASAQLFHLGLQKTDWKYFAVLHISNNLSVISVLMPTGYALQRTINLGEDLFCDSIQEALIEQRGMSDRDAHKKALELIYNGSPTQEDADLVEAATLLNLERAVKYIERTLSFYDRNEREHALEGLYVIAGAGIERLVRNAVESDTGLPCQACSFDQIATTETLARIDQIRHEAGRFGLTDAVGLALAGEQLPNLLEPPALRRKLAAQERIMTAVKGALVLSCIAVGALGAWWGGQWVETTQKLRAEEAQLNAIGERFTPAALQQEVGTLTALERQGAQVLKRRRFAALLTEFAALRPENVYLTDIRYEETMPEAVRSRRQDAQKTAGPVRVVTVRAVLYGNTQSRETTLAEFIKRVENAAGGGVMSVRKEDVRGNAWPVELKVTGGF